ncbi:hypothetical protein [Agathobaculum sp.]|uniref:hypothetical protein n=1 Tax=Agathobaculum sp. TaxID=2048138 RepID=UPI003521F2FB
MNSKVKASSLPFGKEYTIKAKTMQPALVRSPAAGRENLPGYQRISWGNIVKAKKAALSFERTAFYGASGDTELFEKASNINGFQGGRVANNLYISPFRATVLRQPPFFYT